MADNEQEISKTANMKFNVIYAKITSSYKAMIARYDSLNEALEEAKLSDQDKEKKRIKLGKRESDYLRSIRTRLGPGDFLPLRTIGRGAFGFVKLVQKKDTAEVFAMKILKKKDIQEKEQVGHIRAERDILAQANNKWVVKMFYSFQDSNNLYLVMEFLPGGDMMTLLIKYDVLETEWCRFVLSECIEAIGFIHSLNFIHRDIKPDNILFDQNGHIKMTDFGLCTGLKKSHRTDFYRNIGKISINDLKENSTSSRKVLDTWKVRRRELAASTVGTPDYVAPEMLSQDGYTNSCDWWSLGTIIFEMRCGYPPFSSETPEITYKKIILFDQTLQFPPESDITEEEQNLVLKLCTKADARLGKNGADEIKQHPYLAGVDFKNIRNRPSPIPIKVNGFTDTSNFDHFDEDDITRHLTDIPANDINKHKDWLYFRDYTFTRPDELQKMILKEANN